MLTQHFPDVGVVLFVLTQFHVFLQIVQFIGYRFCVFIVDLIAQTVKSIRLFCCL